MNDAKKIIEMNNYNQFERDDKEGNQDEKKMDKNVKMSEDNRMMNMLVNKLKEMETEYDLVSHLVIDLGNAVTKIGFSGEDLPRFRIPSVYAESIIDQDKKNEFTFEIKPHLFGEEALRNKNKESYNLKFLNPGNHKNLLDGEFYDFLKECLENKLGISPSDFKVIVNTSPIKNSQNLARLSKLFIEDLNFKALSIINSSSLSLFSTGRTSGLVVECGESRSYTVPIYEGFPLYHAMNKNRIGGKDLTKVISEGIIEAGIDLSPDDLINLRMIKEKTCSVPYLKSFEDYANGNEDIILPEKRLYKITDDETVPEKRLYKLPDDQVIIEIPKVLRLLASELLFTPSVLGKPDRGLVSLIADSIKKTAIDNDELRKIMLHNIVLSGGTTMMPGFSQRIKSTIFQHLDSDFSYQSPFSIIAELNRDISTWVGASMVASMSSFEKTFIKKEEYYENGEDRLTLFSKIF